MTDKQPLGPALAAALGGEWDGQAVTYAWTRIWADLGGRVWLSTDGRTMTRLGSVSDGVDALAQAARNHGVGT